MAGLVMIRDQGSFAYKRNDKSFQTVSPGTLFGTGFQQDTFEVTITVCE